MSARKLIIGIAIVLLAIGIGAGAYWVGMSRGMQMGSAPSARPGSTAASKAGDIDPSNGKKILYWHDPMVPGQRFDKPGKSPFMDMQLVPVYEDAGAGGSSVRIDPTLQQNLGIRVGEVRRGTLEQAVHAVGSVAYNERDVAAVQARNNGFLEKLYVRATLDAVAKGQPLADVYVPEWIAAQEEYLSAKRISSATQVSGLESLVEGARQRMQLVGMTEDQVAAIERTGRVQPRITIVAPIAGVITELGAREGMTVTTGTALFRINGLSTVWVNAEVPESLATQVRPGAVVVAHVDAFPGESFDGRVGAIVPEVNPSTRTLKARIELRNPRGKLVPGMFADVELTPASPREALLVPSEAVIQTGKRSVVIVAQGDGRFAPVDVEAGTESNGVTEIRRGLQPGQKVVLSGQFLIDSEASLRATATRMNEPAEAAASGAQATYRTTGRVERVGADEITLSHEPVPALSWPAMTMGFAVSASLQPKPKEGDKVTFEFRPLPDGKFEITRIEAAK